MANLLATTPRVGALGKSSTATQTPSRYRRLGTLYLYADKGLIDEATQDIAPMAGLLNNSSECGCR